ncbi:MAG: hypothetical protein OEZ57_01745 [Nitrospirota bacterium]|nr:hypothetical protein [Nitrospirota bacterium]MDH5587675.1 hypothetical protein [Nitrospirota bacterium]MDH5773624.1 hypothetical protein [Nitrospirota bacterium]
MRTLRSSFLAASLVVLLLLLGGVLSAQAVGHVSQHTHHHSSSTHATTLCSWYCAAGQLHAGELVVVAAPIVSFLGIEEEEPSTVIPIFVIPSPSRAPPSS